MTRWGRGEAALHRDSRISPSCYVLFLAIPKISSDVPKIYQQQCLEESGLRHDNVDQTCLVLAR